MTAGICRVAHKILEGANSLRRCGRISRIGRVCESQWYYFLEISVYQCASVVLKAVVFVPFLRAHCSEKNDTLVTAMLR
jgi:hypothetical protein